MDKNWILYLTRYLTLDLFGILTNGLIFYLLLRHKNNPNGRPSDYFTLSMSLVNILFILCSGVNQFPGIFLESDVHVKLVRYARNVPYYWFSLIPQILLLCRTYCHYLAICDPFKFRDIVTKQNVSKCIKYTGMMLWIRI